MESQNNAVETTQTASAAKANWDALTTDEVEVSQNPAQEVKAEETPIVGGNQTINTDEPAKTEEPKKEDAPAATTEAKTEVVDTPAADELTLDVKDIKDAPKVYEQDTFQALGQMLNVNVAEESVDSFKKAIEEQYVHKSEFDKVKSMSKDDLLTTFDPEVAAAIKLKDIGVPEQYIFNPTGQHDYLLSLDDAQLLRMKYENDPNFTEEMVNLKMEELSESGKLAASAQIERLGISNEKKQILDTKSQLVQQYTEQKQLTEIKAKQEAEAHFINALNKEATFMGLSISKEAKSLIEAKFKQGSYDKVLNDAQSRVLAVLHNEFGERFTKAALSKAKESGKAEIVAKLSDVPMKKTDGGGRQVASEEPNKNPWAALME